MEAIETRIGQIVSGDNRFFGRSVCSQWIHEWQAPSDAVLTALGLTNIDARIREAARLITLCLTSPDARIWPLKLTRLLASWGSPLTGYFGGQLVSTGQIMGPGASVGAARCLAWIAKRVVNPADPLEVAHLLQQWTAEHGGKIQGFGVPFRKRDERRDALLTWIGDGELAQGVHWQVHRHVVTAMAPQSPNCVISLSALLLDIGISAEHCGLALNALMAHVFLAHAIEASTSDAKALHAWPAEQIRYCGLPKRSLCDHTLNCEISSVSICTPYTTGDLQPSSSSSKTSPQSLGYTEVGRDVGP